MEQVTEPEFIFLYDGGLSHSGLSFMDVEAQEEYKIYKFVYTG
jgi:hypothetical protein